MYYLLQSTERKRDLMIAGSFSLVVLMSVRRSSLGRYAAPPTRYAAFSPVPLHA